MIKSVQWLENVILSIRAFFCPRHRCRRRVCEMQTIASTDVRMSYRSYALQQTKTSEWDSFERRAKKKKKWKKMWKCMNHIMEEEPVRCAIARYCVQFEPFERHEESSNSKKKLKQNRENWIFPASVQQCKESHQHPYTQAERCSHTPAHMPTHM